MRFRALILFVYFVGCLSDRSPETGPCVLNNDNFKCNIHGYYESVQCDADSCFCVTPHSGIISYETRTTNSKITPKCGACLVYLQKLFKNGDPPAKSFIPKCDVAHGDFESLQCEPSANRCYCVDRKTGREIAGTRSSLDNTKNKKCNQIEFSIDASEFEAFDKNAPASNIPDILAGRPQCTIDRNPGTTCPQNRTSIKYWFDAHTFQCLPFEHKGCGGNANKFNTKAACYETCVMADYFSCAFNSRPARKSNRQYYTCGNLAAPGMKAISTPGPKLNNDGCPRGYTCVMGAFFGFCCDENLQSKFNAAFRPECSNRKPALVERADGFTSTVIGKSCADRFCPASHRCEQGAVYAYCCPK
ncbi:unnamed protein product [Caenorhabditis bovis]|uniref:BPTI/Kunitz inhibitor domain-containing protein n=1 Tax=Caenorhabditis bovis TaxID=2654633 RepID=A0A8S1EL06_9PELO|nr:unnamed protein product [Caenorhabditis bovis]